MTVENKTVAEWACPGRDELMAFNVGLVPSSRLEALAEHVSACAPCESSLQALQAEDTVQSLLRRRPTPLPPADEAACVLLEDRARAIPGSEEATTLWMGAFARLTEEPSLPLVFGTHLLLEQLGKGGMGIVYKARQETLRWLIALKVVRAGALAGDEERARFRREGEALARVHHANIVQIYEFGECQGQPFYTMELLEGGTLTDRLNGGPLPEREAAELTRTLAQALHALHQKGIVHRDLKPGNILFAADGTPKITDFGLAKVLDTDNAQTRSDVIMGTPKYMAPEQASGESRAIGPSADVYALGVILYEMLAGEPPFAAETRLQTMDLVRTREPEPPSRRRPKLDRVLEAICLTCLAKEPAQRYASAAALAEDLDRWLQGEPTRVRPPSRGARVWRRVRGHRRALAAVGLLLLLPSVLLALLYVRDPKRRLADLEARLRRGETVALIGDKGDPAWHKWGLRQGTIAPSRLKDGTFSIQAEEAAMLTLLPDPQGSYRFSAEVRHEAVAPRLGQVGLVFVHSRPATPEGMQNCFCTLTFNDIEALYPDPQTKQTMSRVSFTVRRTPEGGPDKSCPMALKHFPPAAVETPGQSPWRPLAVEVRPEGIDLFWNGEPFASPTHQQILDRFAPLKRVPVGNRFQMGELFPALQPAFSPRDALGLFVQNGQASFRRVRIEPLP